MLSFLHCIAKNLSDIVYRKEYAAGTTEVVVGVGILGSNPQFLIVSLANGLKTSEKSSLKELGPEMCF